MTAEELLAAGNAALAVGRWGEARAAFEAALAGEETAEACFGLAAASWWLGENHESVTRCARAYSLFRQAGEVPSAVQCAVWLGITYKANFANFAAASGWIGRAERLLESLEPGPLHGWTWVARAYRMDDLDEAEELTVRAVDVARQAGDVDLELVALAQLGLIRVGQGATGAGFALIDEAMAAALAGEGSTLDTVVYACCDMLNACELASDIERATQWCKVADDFVETYGCPFLYAECRIYYGSVLAAKGRWDDAERELGAGLRITDGACPGLHTKALIRLADLRVRQGRVEEAEQLLSHLGAGVEAEAEEALSLAALLLARGDAPAASRNLEQRLHRLAAHRSHLAGALDLLVDAYVASGDRDAASAAVERLADVVAPVDSDRLGAIVASARGRVAIAWGDPEAAIAHLEAALEGWSRLDFPFEAARIRFEIGRVLAPSHPDVAVDHARRALAAFEALGAALDADRVAAFLRSQGVTPRTASPGSGRAHDAGAGSAPAPRGGPVQPGDRRAAPREPQDGVAPCEQHPHQAQPAQPSRGRRLRRRRARPAGRPNVRAPLTPRSGNSRREMGQLPHAHRTGRPHHRSMTTSTEPSESFQIPIEAAEFYESAFVPAFFAQWAPMLCEAAGVAPGQTVLDVACGTGIVARTAADLVAPEGQVVGLDLNEAMLTVARRVRPDIEWRQGNAATLPFPDGSFDTVLCQMALMFFPDRLNALKEMGRVVRPGGTVAIAVPSRLDAQVAFSPFVDMAARHAGPEAMSLLSAYFVCGDLDELTGLVESAGLRVAGARTHVGTYRAPSVDAFVTTEVESTPLVERISDAMYQRIRADAHEVLGPFTAPDGSVEAAFECHVVAAGRP